MSKEFIPIIKRHAILAAKLADSHPAVLIADEPVALRPLLHRSAPGAIDVKPGVTTTLSAAAKSSLSTSSIAFLITAIPAATIAIIRSASNKLPKLTGQPLPWSDLMALEYLTLAKFESGFDTGASNNISTAKGAIQLLKNTYERMAIVGSQLVASGPANLRAYLTTLFRITEPFEGGAWAEYNRLHPANDITQAYASAGQVFTITSCVLRDFKWTGITWVPKAVAPSARIIQCTKQYADVLRSFAGGYSALCAIYHTEGESYLRNSGTFNLHYSDRPISDANTMQTLTADLSLRRVLQGIDLLVNQGSGLQGDPALDSDVKEMGFPFIFLPLLKFAKDKLPQITAKFGEKRKKNAKRGMLHATHKGLDLRAKEGTDIYAPADAVVDSLYSSLKQGSWGKSIVLRFTDGAKMRFAHLSKILVKPDQAIKEGERIGKSGHTGVVEPHLHLEFIAAGQTVQSDPLTDELGRWKKVFGASTVPDESPAGQLKHVVSH